MITEQEQVILKFLDSCDIKEGDIEESGVMLDLTMIRDFVPEYIAKEVEPVKPRVKVEYVEVRDFSFDLKADFDEGTLYIDEMADEYTQLKDESEVAFNFMNGVLYKKVESEMTWQDEVVSLLGSAYGTASLSHLVEQDADLFIEMCKRTVHSLTK
jgi:hypothetical protein